MHDELGTKTLGALLCLTPGEIHLRELLRQTRQEGVQLDLEQHLSVHALSADGVPLYVDLRLARKWSTRGWELQLACPFCKAASRVLRERDGVFCCARCAPRSTQHHQLKNTRYWREGGKTTAAIIQRLKDGSVVRQARLFSALQQGLVRDVMDRADAAVSVGTTALNLTDAVASEGQGRMVNGRRRRPAQTALPVDGHNYPCRGEVAHTTAPTDQSWERLAKLR